MQQAADRPRGLVRNDPAALDGYVLFSTFRSDMVYLVDGEGRVVHTWKNDKAGDALYLMDNGDLLRLARIPEPLNFRTGGVAGYIQRLSWEGTVLWEWKLSDEKRTLHHDIEPLPNGNVLAIAWEVKSPEEAKKVGRRADLVPEAGLWSEWLLEIEPLPPDDARVVWEWHVWDHLVPPDGAPEDHPRRLDINADAGSVEIDEEELEQLKALGYVPDDATQEDLQSDFLHTNAVDYHPRLDQIALSVPRLGEIWILDHSTTTDQARGSTGGRYGHGGDFLYRWGNPRVYGRGTHADQQLFGQHEVLWIPDGWENEGNLTVFNNGGGRSDGDWSSVLEIAPPIESDGSYRQEQGKPFGPEKPVWTYHAEDRPSFFAPFVSGAHRLPNGHTFVCSGPQGRYFEVTRKGEIVWEYRNPFHGALDVWTPETAAKLPYPSFRATKIASDHPALAGRELVPLDPQPAVYEPPD